MNPSSSTKSPRSVLIGSVRLSLAALVFTYGSGEFDLRKRGDDFEGFEADGDDLGDEAEDVLFVVEGFGLQDFNHLLQRSVENR